MTSPLLLIALASVPQILLPPWPLRPDGDLVAVRGEAPLVAEGASVEKVASGLFRVVPAEGVEEVRLSAGSARTAASVDRVIAPIQISIRPLAPVKGRDEEVTLDIVVAAAPAAEPDARAPLLISSSGRVREVTPVGAGRFRAVFEPAPTRHPEVAILVAVAPRCPLCATPRAVGHAIVPLAAAIELPGTSEPGVQTTVSVGGRTFGPVVADQAGRFSIPVVVPPGARFGAAVSVDRTGNTRKTELDLHLPPVDRLACAGWPRAIPADGRSAAGIWCVASSASGAPAPDARIVVSASRGAVGPLAPFRGALQRARYVAPSGGGGERVLVSAAYPGGGAASKHEISIDLATGAPADLTATLAREPVPLGGMVDAELVVRDARGDRIGVPSGPAGAAEGFVAPGRFLARTEPGDFTQEAVLRFALPSGDDVATVTLRREGPSWIAEARTVDARPAAGVPLRFGSGVVVATDARGEARAPATGGAESVTAESGARAAGWEGIAPPPAPFEIERTIAVALSPSAPVEIVARLEEGQLRWRVLDAQGRVLPRRAVSLRASGVVLGPTERDGDGGRASIRGRGVVAVVDVETGVAAVVEVP